MTMLHWIKNISKELEIIRQNQMEMLVLKILITERKNSLEGLSSRFKLAGERISKFKDWSIELMQSE